MPKTQNLIAYLTQRNAREGRPVMCRFNEQFIQDSGGGSTQGGPFPTELANALDVLLKAGSFVRKSDDKFRSALEVWSEEALAMLKEIDVEFAPVTSGPTSVN